MSWVPTTYLFDFEHCNDLTRPFVMQEFADNGAENLVLSDTLIKEVLKDPHFADKLHKDLAASGTRFVDAHAPFGVYQDLNVPVPELRDNMLERMQLALRIAADFGVSTIAVHVGNSRPNYFAEYTLQQHHEAICQSLETLLPLAEKLQVCLAIENIWFPTNTADKLLDMLQRFPSPYLGVCYDAGHANLMVRDRGLSESGPMQAWEAYGEVEYDAQTLEKLLPYIVTCHLHDNDGSRDQHLLPGTGCVDWEHCISNLKKAPRLQCLQSEVIPVRCNVSIARLCRCFKELLK